jgi:hypothetical protein
MTMDIDLKKRFIDATMDDFVTVLEWFTKADVRPAKILDTTKSDRNFVYGLAGLANLFGCSKTTANRIKQSGKIDKAITQIGNLIIVDADKAIELAGTINGKHSKK